MLSILGFDVALNRSAKDARLLQAVCCIAFCCQVTLAPLSIVVLTPGAQST